MMKLMRSAKAAFTAPAHEQTQQSAALGRGGSLPKYRPKVITDKIEHRRKVEANNKSGAKLSFSDIE
jgi:hypothetical protein